MLALGQRKGKKQVTIVYGLDLFGIKLKDAAKAAKRKFATGSSITIVRSFDIFHLFSSFWLHVTPLSLGTYRVFFLYAFFFLVCFEQSPDNRDVIEIQGSRQQDFAQLAHSEWGVS